MMYEQDNRMNGEVKLRISNTDSEFAVSVMFEDGTERFVGLEYGAFSGAKLAVMPEGKYHRIVCYKTLRTLLRFAAEDPRFIHVTIHERPKEFIRKGLTQETFDSLDKLIGDNE